MLLFNIAYRGARTPSKFSTNDENLFKKTIKRKVTLNKKKKTINRTILLPYFNLDLPIFLEYTVLEELLTELKYNVKGYQF